MIKIYKDLLVTKRDLIDLRESINQTIRSIRNSDRAINHMQEGERRCRYCRKEVNPAEGHQCENDERRRGELMTTRLRHQESK